MKDVKSLVLDCFKDRISRIEYQEEQELLRAAIQIVGVTNSDHLAIESGILLDIIDYPIGDTLTLSEIAEQVTDRGNWEKWRSIDPLVVADLKKSEDIAAEIINRKRVSVQVRINKNLVTFYSKLKLGHEQQDMFEIQNVVDAFIEAWKLHLNWIHSDERRELRGKQTSLDI